MCCQYYENASKVKIDFNFAVECLTDYRFSQELLSEEEKKIIAEIEDGKIKDCQKNLDRIGTEIASFFGLKYREEKMTADENNSVFIYFVENSAYNKLQAASANLLFNILTTPDIRAGIRNVITDDEIDLLRKGIDVRVKAPDIIGNIQKGIRNTLLWNERDSFYGLLSKNAHISTDYRSGIVVIPSDIEISLFDSYENKLFSTTIEKNRYFEFEECKKYFPIATDDDAYLKILSVSFDKGLVWHGSYGPRNYQVDTDAIEKLRSDYENGQLVFDKNTDLDFIESLENYLNDRPFQMRTPRESVSIARAIKNPRISFAIKDERFHRAMSIDRLSFNNTSEFVACRLDVVLIKYILDPSGVYTLEHSSKKITLQNEVSKIKYDATPSDRFSFRGDRLF